MHWASGADCEHSPLGRLLFGADGPAGEPSERAAIERIEAIAAVAPPGTVAVERATGPEHGALVRRAGAGRPRSHARPFDPPARPGVAPHVLQRRSTAGGQGARRGERARGSPARSTRTSRSPCVPARRRTELDPLADVELPLAAIAGGARVGTLLHGVLEHTDFTADDLDAELRRALAGEPGWDPTGVGPADALVARPRAGDRDPARSARRRPPAARRPAPRPARRADVRAAARRRRPPSGRRRRPRPSPTCSSATSARTTRSPATRPRLRDPLLDQPLRGYLNGSIDAVLRLPGDGTAAASFAVVDYKSNWLAPNGRVAAIAGPSVPSSRPGTTAPTRSPSPCSTPTTRCRRCCTSSPCTASCAGGWRGYDPDVHLAGVLYLFLRGMVGPDTPVVDGGPCGVFAWRPSGALVVATSDLLDRGRDG